MLHNDTQEGCRVTYRSCRIFTHRIQILELARLLIQSEISRRLPILHQMMELEILDALEDLGWTPKCQTEQDLKLLFADWKQFSSLVAWVSLQLNSVTQVEEVINPMTKDEDLTGFLMEISSLLNELGCPYSQITEGHLTTRFDGYSQKILVLNFLLSELESARMSYVDEPKQLKVELQESSQARVVREILQTLGLGKPPENINISALCKKIRESVPELQRIRKHDESPLFKGVLSSTQWKLLEDLQLQLQSEYQMRREMLLKRLDVTIQSFHWSDRLHSKKDNMASLFREYRVSLYPKPSVTITDLLAARVDLAVLEKTSCASVRTNTRSTVNNVVIGRVPDRGGRPTEIQAPPPEMPPWQQRQGGAPGGGQSGNSGWIQGGQQRNSDNNRGRGDMHSGQSRGRVQGGWSNAGQNTQADYQGSQQWQNKNTYQSQSQGYDNNSYQRNDGNAYQQNAPTQQNYCQDDGYNNRNPRRGRGGGGGRGYR